MKSTAPRRLLFAMLAFFSVAAIAAACRDNGGDVTGASPGRPRFQEIYELDTLEVSACPPGTSGETPNCIPDPQPDYCTDNPSDPACDPCTTNPGGCEGPPDPCANSSCSGGGGSSNELPESWEGEDKCPNCGEKDMSTKQRAALVNLAHSIPCASMRGLAEQLLSSNSTSKVFTTWGGNLGVHADGVIYIYEGMFKPDGAGDLAAVRSPSQLRRTITHEVAHYYWSTIMHYEGHLDPSNPDFGDVHHSRWDSTMSECGY